MCLHSLNQVRDRDRDHDRDRDRDRDRDLTADDAVHAMQNFGTLINVQVYNETKRTTVGRKPLVHQ